MESFSIKRILKILVPKIKVLVILLLIGAVIGGSVGIAKTVASKIYGTQMAYYVNPSKNTDDSGLIVYGAYGWNVMDNMTKLLASESFAELLLLDDNGIPLRDVLNDLEDRAEINEKISEAKALIAEAKAAKEAYESAAEVDKAEKEAEWQAKETAVSLKLSEVDEIWTDTEVYENYIRMITKSVTYSFYNEKDAAIGAPEAIAKSFFYVDIRVSESEELAQFIYDRLEIVLPEYIKGNMMVPDGYDGTECVKITRLDKIEQIDTGNLAIEAIKNAIIFSIITVILSIIVIVVMDEFKRWLKKNKQFLVDLASGVDTEETNDTVKEETEKKEELAPEQQ